MFERRELTILGSKVSYLRAGNAEHPALILLHGGGSDFSEFSWREIIPRLSDHFSIYAPDLPGYGHSAMPCIEKCKSALTATTIREIISGSQKRPLTDGASTLELHTIFLKHFIDHLGLGSPILAGFSMGGAICLLYGLAYPQAINKIAAINSYGVSDRIRRQQLAWITARIPFLPQTLRFVLSRFRIVMRLALGELVAEKRSIKTAMVEDAMASVRLVGRHPLWKEFVRQEILFGGCNLNLADKLSEIGNRICLIQTEKDRLFFPEKIRRAANTAGAGFKLLKKAGHIPARECPVRLADGMLLFLNGAQAEPDFVSR